ncbi:MAG: BA14K family protein, partial [Bradyrhizobium sp.]|nr:BA14K family protein [Bradyrhizobium sp.]
YVQQGDGSWVGVSPRYCQTAQYAPRERYAPRQQYYEEAPACTRYRSYDPRTGTYIGRDGYQRPCP